MNLNGVDRKNNELFYNIENSLPCCKSCNSMKMAMTYDEFITKIKKIIERLNPHP